MTLTETRTFRIEDVEEVFNEKNGAKIGGTLQPAPPPHWNSLVTPALPKGSSTGLRRFLRRRSGR